MSITVTTENKIIVRCPWEASRKAVDEFIESKEGWVEKVVLKNAIKLASNDDVIEHKSVYVCGKKLPIVISDKNLITDTCVYLKDFADIEKLFTDSFSAEFIAEVNKIAAEARLYPNSVGIKGYKGRWGCCDAQNNLIFNYILFMLPKPVRRYVIVHELCHTVCHNHSDGFWKLVSEFEPQYKSLRATLKEYDFLTAVY